MCDIKSKIKTLNKYRTMKKEYECLIERYRRFIHAPDELKAQALSCMPRSNSSNFDKMTDSIAEKIKLEQTITKRHDDLLKALVEIEEAISSIDDSLLRTLLSLRYVDCLKWEPICVKMNYSWRQIHNIHEEALKNIEI